MLTLLYIAILLRRYHTAQIAALERSHSERCSAYKSAANSAASELSTAEYELTKEREAHLATLKELRRANEQLR